MTLIAHPSRFALAMLLLLATTAAFAQEGDSTRQTVRHALYGGLGFGSDMTYSGYSLSDTQPYYSADLLYSYNRTWTAAFMAYHLAGTQPTIAFYDFHKIDLKVESAVGEGSRFFLPFPPFELLRRNLDNFLVFFWGLKPILHPLFIIGTPSLLRT